MNRSVIDKKNNYLLFVIIYILMILTGCIVPFFSNIEYSIVRNSLSELGAQNTKHSWIMNAVIIALSLVTFMNGIKIIGKHHLQLFVVSIFCTSHILTGIFSSAPIDRELGFNSFQNEMHSVFSIITGVFFFAFCITISFIARWKNQKLLALTIGVIVLLLSYAMFVHSDYRGLYQRGIFMIAFGWILYSFKFYEYTITKKEHLKTLHKD